MAQRTAALWVPRVRHFHFRNQFQEPLRIANIPVAECIISGERSNRALKVT